MGRPMAYHHRHLHNLDQREMFSHLALVIRPPIGHSCQYLRILQGNLPKGFKAIL